MQAKENLFYNTLVKPKSVVSLRISRDYSIRDLINKW